MGQLRDWIAYFGGRGNVAPPLVAPDVLSRQPVLRGEVAAAEEAYQEPAVFDRMDADKWPPEDAPPETAARTDQPIQILVHGPWMVTEDGRVVRSLVGVSDEGHHYAIEVRRRSADPQPLRWSAAFCERQAAEREADAAEKRAIVRGDEPEIAEYVHRLDQARAEPSLHLARETEAPGHDDPDDLEHTHSH
ncbi:hypothetical protein [Muricoccus vinaceus]|uniref:Uncharacterized protein n=1 Tax=Muricoccus vinaceus TaxID=424704 RepID=A0ABV6J2T0_9PROT